MQCKFACVCFALLKHTTYSTISLENETMTTMSKNRIDFRSVKEMEKLIDYEKKRKSVHAKN